jgi:hypothetical protein
MSKNEDLTQKITTAKKGWGMAQVARNLNRKSEILSSNLSTAQKILFGIL